MTAMTRPEVADHLVSPKVSVVCIIYNSMAYLPQTVASVLAQSFGDFELILVDDGSSDNVAEWAATLTDPRISFVSQLNQGIPGARNTGIAHARGLYIAFLDGDDLWDASKLEQQVERLDHSPNVGLVYTHLELIDAHNNYIGRSQTMNAEGDVLSTILVSNFIGSGSSPMVRKRCFDELGVFCRESTLAWCDDWDMWVRIAAHYDFAVIKEPLTCYRLHAGGASTGVKQLVSLVPAIVERIYQNVPSRYLYLRTRTYGTFYLYLALRALETRDFSTAAFLIARVLNHKVSLRWLRSAGQIGLTMTAQQSSLKLTQFREQWRHRR